MRHVAYNSFDDQYSSSQEKALMSISSFTESESVVFYSQEVIIDQRPIEYCVLREKL